MTAHDKLRLDLFPHRMAVFEECMRVLERILQHEQTENDYEDFRKAFFRTSMLFGDDVVKLMSDLSRAVYHHSLALREHKKAETEDRRREFDQMAIDSYLFIGNNQPKLWKAVSAYTSFDTISISASLLKYIDFATSTSIRWAFNRKKKASG